MYYFPDGWDPDHHDAFANMELQQQMNTISSARANQSLSWNYFEAVQP